MQFGLGLHVQPLQLSEHLLEVEAVLGQDEHGAVDSDQAHLGRALRLHVDLEVIARPGLLHAERGGHLVGVLALDVEGDEVSRHLAGGQDLVDQELG